MLNSEWSISMWRGAHDAAREHDANLIYFAGGQLGVPDDVVLNQACAVYDLVNVEMLDGLVIWGSQLSHYVGLEGVKAFIQRYHPLPVINVGPALEGVPSLVIDRHQLIRDILEHLIETHHYRRIAFLEGPEAVAGERQQYSSYCDTLAEKGIPFDPALVASGREIHERRRDSGVLHWRDAIRILLDDRKLRPGIDFEALVGSDQLAIDALEELQERGFRVPYDVAVVGQGDIQGAQHVLPPLTTMHLSPYERGRQAVEALLALLAGEQAPDQIILPSTLVIRQSCGCVDPAIVQAALDPATASGEALENVQDAHRPEILLEMVDAVETSVKGLAPDWAERLLDNFVADAKDESQDAFLLALDEILRQVVATGGDVAAWQGVISVLRRRLRPHLDGEPLSRAGNLWNQGRVLIGGMAQRAQAHQVTMAEQRAQTLRDVGAELITTFNVSGMVDVLAGGLSQLGIPSCYLSLYEDPQAPTTWSRSILAHDEARASRPDGVENLNAHAESGKEGLRFPSRQLAPEGRLPTERQYSFVVEPLFFLKNQLGFILFEVGPREGAVYEALRVQISSALQGALLMEQVGDRALQLQTAAEVSRAVTGVLDLDALLQQVVDLVQKRFNLYYAGLFMVEADEAAAPSAWAVLRAASGEAGRQMLEQGHRLAVGGDSMVGQCITDHQPRIALDVGEEAVRFNNPLLPETHSEMALPLITREGAIGALSVQSRERRAFGEAEVAVFETLAGQLANAIANARAYAQVARAYDEIQALNERLKDENLRMAAELDVTRRLQQMLLPTDDELAQIEGLDIAGWMEPAEEVGGDYYDVLQHNGSVKIGIGDVTGHGLESGVVMLMLQTAVRTLLTSGEEDPVRFLEVLNQLLRDNIRRMQVSKSMTLSLLDYELGRMRLSGQHEYVIVVRAGGKVELQDTLDLGFPLGIEHGIAQWVDEMDIALAPGDGVVLYSDGITEAEDEGGEFYGLKRLCEVVSTSWGGSAEEVKDAVMTDVKGFIGNQRVYDDLTLVVAKQQ